MEDEVISEMVLERVVTSSLGKPIWLVAEKGGINGLSMYRVNII